MLFFSGDLLRPHLKQRYEKMLSNNNLSKMGKTIHSICESYYKSALKLPKLTVLESIDKVNLALFTSQGQTAYLLTALALNRAISSYFTEVSY